MKINSIYKSKLFVNNEMKVITKYGNTKLFVNKHSITTKDNFGESYAKMTEKYRYIFRESFPNNTNQFHHDTSPTNN